ncbi:YkgJ family cysteine cluster protein [Halorussus salinisoli]|uniref:YkgJ family cysteine cluster protein n=1 Tax=Halorussus salinisoli TaxID=2558242 RepID=UPI0010C1809B|nr:YkgJ family cysteine cluster protein [Halorussus salinisoli]
MQSLEAELERARELDTADLADAIESIGFECTRCGACCKAEADDPHTATVFPDEVRDLQAATEYDWRDVARPMPYGLDDGESADTDDAEDDAETDESESETEPTGETFEWALQTDACGDCAFYEEADDGTGACSVHGDRPLICETYPFSVALGGTSQPMGEAVDEAGMVRAHECEGLGRDISREDAEELAAALKERAVRELAEAIAVRDEYAPADPDEGVVVHDSEGAKRPDGSAYEG